jgi:4-alpha-glucanotransferase
MDTYPYAAISAFALHPMYIHLPKLLHKGQENILVTYQQTIADLNVLSDVDYEAVMHLKWEVLRLLYAKNGKKDVASKRFEAFYEQNKNWLPSYAAFSYLRDQYKTVDFNTWPQHAQYHQKAIDQLIADQYDEIAFYYYIQFHLHEQLVETTSYARIRGVVLKGDIPIGVYRYGVDAWQNRHLFHMDMQAGAPPDDFAVHGQNWGFPTYNWEQMAKDDFAWWKSRFDQMKYYFGAFRIDHILGFFRIWSIPLDAVDGIMGHFVPAIPVSIHELNAKGIQVDQYRLTQPFINEETIFEKFGYDNEYIKATFLHEIAFQQYAFKTEFDTQRKIESYFKELDNIEKQQAYQQGLYDLLSNVILFNADKANEFHFRFNMDQTQSFKCLDPHTQNGLRELYVDYFFKKQDAAWEKEALQKLPKLRMSTNMLICGEDLGLVPSCVPNVMHQLGLLSLEVQRMPKATDQLFFHPNDAPYMSVVTPSSHDTSTIRGWWEEDRAMTQLFYNQVMGQWGDAPQYCEAWINKAILVQHLFSPAMWSIFQLQDYLGVDAALRRDDPQAERINVPANPKHYWRYRMHITLESLITNTSFNEDWKMMIQTSGR